jgi:hypothetical protein
MARRRIATSWVFRPMVPRLAVIYGVVMSSLPPEIDDQVAYSLDEARRTRTVDPLLTMALPRLPCPIAVSNRTLWATSESHAALLAKE